MAHWTYKGILNQCKTIAYMNQKQREVKANYIIFVTFVSTGKYITKKDLVYSY